MSVRTYNPSVLIGNWNEDICSEEVSMFEYSLQCCSECKLVVFSNSCEL